MLLPSRQKTRLTSSIRAAATELSQVPAPSSYAAFLTHDLGIDELGRKNHERVCRVNDMLKEAGFKTWYDEERMHGDIDQQMAEGIDASTIVVVFVTHRYLQKVAGHGDRGADDNCKFEFDYALQRKGVNFMIPVVMEPRCLNTSTWQGKVGGKLGSKLYINLTSDADDFFKAGVDRIVEEMRHIAQQLPRWSAPEFDVAPSHPVADFKEELPAKQEQPVLKAVVAEVAPSSVVVDEMSTMSLSNRLFLPCSYSSSSSAPTAADATNDLTVSSWLVPISESLQEMSKRFSTMSTVVKAFDAEQDDTLRA